MTDLPDFTNPDLADQWGIAALNAEGIDTTQVWGVTGDLGFFSEQAARQAAAELMMAGYGGKGCADGLERRAKPALSADDQLDHDRDSQHGAHAGCGSFHADRPGPVTHREGRQMGERWRRLAGH